MKFSSLFFIFLFGLSPLVAPASSLNPSCSEVPLTPEVADLCSSHKNEERFYEYIQCSAFAMDEQITEHYIVQTTWEGEKNASLGHWSRLFQAEGKMTDSLIQLTNLRVVDSHPKASESDYADLSFTSETLGLEFELVITSTDGELMEGQVFNNLTGEKKALSCRDVAY
jgi:hypothetical protein